MGLRKLEVMILLNRQFQMLIQRSPFMDIKTGTPHLYIMVPANSNKKDGMSIVIRGDTKLFTINIDKLSEHQQNSF